jgi:hypothetical protein
MGPIPPIDLSIKPLYWLSYPVYVPSAKLNVFREDGLPRVQIQWLCWKWDRFPPHRPVHKTIISTELSRLCTFICSQRKTKCVSRRRFTQSSDPINCTGQQQPYIKTKSNELRGSWVKEIYEFPVTLASQEASRLSNVEYSSYVQVCSATYALHGIHAQGRTWCEYAQAISNVTFPFFCCLKVWIRKA